MACSILIHHIPADLKFQIEQLPEYEYGCVNDLYIKIVRFYIQSPELRLERINQIVTGLESRTGTVCSRIDRLAALVAELDARLVQANSELKKVDATLSALAPTLASGCCAGRTT